MLPALQEQLVDNCGRRGVNSTADRPEHTKRTQGNAEQRKATHAGQAEPTQQIQHQQTKNRTPRVPNASRNHRRPKTETYTPTASHSPRNHQSRPTSTAPSKPTKPSKDHPGSYQPPPSAPEAYKQRPSTSRHHSVWSVHFTLRNVPVPANAKTVNPTRDAPATPMRHGVGDAFGHAFRSS